MAEREKAAAPQKPPTDQEKYADALRRVLVLKEKYPQLHGAVLEVVGKHIGDCVKGFFGHDYDPAASASYHARFKDLDKVARTLGNPASFIKDETEKKDAPGGGLRGAVAGEMKALLAGARGIAGWARDRLGGKKGD